MISGGFDNDNINNSLQSGLSKGSNLLSRTGRNAGRKAGRFLNKGLKGILKKTGKAVGNTIRILPKNILIIIAVFVLFFFFFSSCAYLAEGEDDGETGSYIDHNNVVSSNGTISYSTANGNCRMYYRLLSEKKSVWQEYVDENGETVLIHPDDGRAVSDYFKNDLEYYISPDLLFSMNKYIFGEDFVYPEAFLNPVNYNQDYELIPLTDSENNMVNVKSVEYSETGNDTGNTLDSVSDYGIASVMKYTEQNETTRFAGTYYKQDYLDDDGNVYQQEINEPFDMITESHTYYLLDHVVTFAGDISYSYSPSTTQVSVVSTGSVSSNETDLAEMYEFYSATESFSKVCRKVTDKDGNKIPVTSGFPVSEFPVFKTFMKYDSNIDTGYTEDEIASWINTHTQTISFTDKNGVLKEAYVSYEYIPNAFNREYSLRKYRTCDSGIYVDFVSQSGSEVNNLGNQYLYDYLQNFSCYTPIITRSYETFYKMTSQADTSSSVLLSESDLSKGDGTTVFEQIYNGSDEGRVLLETIWDILVSWGYSEEQAASVMGNMAQESGYRTSVVNSIGAHGLCQWLSGRWEKLRNYAGSMNKDWTDVEVQVTFACMELSTTNRYSQCEYQWSGNEDKAQIFETSSDIEEITIAICQGWERCGNSEANMDNRVQNALFAYSTFSGRVPEHEVVPIAPIDSSDGNIVMTYDTSYATRNMTETDKKTFNDFYHSVDDIFSGEYTLRFYSKQLTKDDVDKLLMLASSYINQTTLSEERLNSTSALWEADYLTDLSKQTKTVAGMYGVDYLDSPRLTVESVSGLPYYFSDNPFYLSGYGLPNCTTWAWGRRYEIEGTPPNLSTGDAYTFWEENEKNHYYLTGDVPKAGAVMVWSKSGGAGHVAIVEQVNGDGTITISQSGWRTWAWNPYIIKTGTIEEIEYYNGPPYTFLGYIYLDRAD